MRRKLFLYMISLVVIILSFLSIGLFFLDSFSSAKSILARDLSFQLNVFERQIDKYYDDLTMMGISLSDNIEKITEAYLKQNNIEFSDVNDNLEAITGLQSAIFPKLHEELLKTDCSGAFVIFDATVNTTLENAEFSKTGLYFQRSTLDATDDSILLYRGIAELGRKNGIMPHRKWRLEFRTDFIPDYGTFPKQTSISSKKPIRLLNVLTLPGTSERAMHFMIQLWGSNGISYGFCGFEISESYFKTYFAQATQLTHLTCLLTKDRDETLNSEYGFSAGVFNGYFLPPNGEMAINDFGEGLVTLNGDCSYVGKTEKLMICNENYFLAVIIPQSEYDALATQNTIQVVCLILLLLGIIVSVCIFFSRKFVAPLLKSLDQIRKQDRKEASSTFVEIDDLFVFLAEQDRIHDEERAAFLRENSENESILKTQKAEIDRLAYSRKSEIDPDDYKAFKLGIKALTKTEKIIFDLYISGKTAKEIMEELGIQDSTLKYHNHNILGKLNVPSRKQMLRYATLLSQESETER